MSWSIERSRQPLSCATRPPDRAEPILQTRRRDEPKEAHLLGARIRDLVLQAAADQDRRFRANVVKLAFNVGLAGAAIAEQQLVTALMGVAILAGTHDYRAYGLGLDARVGYAVGPLQLSVDAAEGIFDLRFSTITAVFTVGYQNL